MKPKYLGLVIVTNFKNKSLELIKNYTILLNYSINNKNKNHEKNYFNSK